MFFDRHVTSWCEKARDSLLLAFVKTSTHWQPNESAGRKLVDGAQKAASISAAVGEGEPGADSSTHNGTHLPTRTLGGGGVEAEPPNSRTTGRTRDDTEQGV